MNDVDEVVAEFLVESGENLDRLDQDLLDLESNPSERSILARVFRTIHTIKGTCGFLGFNKLESVTHVGEGLLSRLRDGDLVLDEPITSVLLAMVDAVRQMLCAVETTGIRDGELPDDAVDNVREIFNVMASAFNTSNPGLHVKLGFFFPPDHGLPGAANGFFGPDARRMDYAVGVEGHGGGVLTVLSM